MHRHSKYFDVFHAINKPTFLVSILINEEADEVKYVKYLGVLIDFQLSFIFHIVEVAK